MIFKLISFWKLNREIRGDIIIIEANNKLYIISKFISVYIEREKKEEIRLLKLLLLSI